MFKEKDLDFAQLIIYIMIAFVLVTYVVLVVYYWQNKDMAYLPIIKNESSKQAETSQKYLDDSLYCENKDDCTWQITDCGGCSCPEPINQQNMIIWDCTDFDPGLNCALACETKNLECLNNTCVAISRGDDILVSYPWPDNKIENTFTIRGQAKGFWFFEGSFPFEIYDKDDNLLLQSYVRAQRGWMTDDWVPFKADVDIVPTNKRGYIIFKRNNPSGLPEYDDSYYVHIRFADYTDNINPDGTIHYNSPNFGFTFDYPADFKIKNQKLNPSSSTDVVLQNKNYLVLGIGREKNTSFKSYEELKTNMKLFIEEGSGVSLNKDNIRNDEFTTINGRKYYYLDASNGTINGLSLYSTIEGEDTIYVSLFYIYNSPQEFEDIHDMLIKIVESIKI